MPNKKIKQPSKETIEKVCEELEEKSGKVRKKTDGQYMKEFFESLDEDRKEIQAFVDIKNPTLKQMKDGMKKIDKRGEKLIKMSNLTLKYLGKEDQEKVKKAMKDEIESRKKLKGFYKKLVKNKKRLRRSELMCEIIGFPFRLFDEKPGKLTIFFVILGLICCLFVPFLHAVPVGCILYILGAKILSIKTNAHLKKRKLLMSFVFEAREKKTGKGNHKKSKNIITEGLYKVRYNHKITYDFIKEVREGIKMGLESDGFEVLNEGYLLKIFELEA